MEKKKKKKVMIVMSMPVWLSIFKSAIQQELPYLANDAIYIDSFDKAVDLSPTDCDLVVISCDDFKEEKSDSKKTKKETGPDYEKSGCSLAEIIKRINPNCKFYVFSEFEVEKNEFIDGSVKIHQFGNFYSSDVLKALKFLR